MEHRTVFVFVLGLLIIGIPISAQSYVLSRQLSGIENQIGLINQEIDELWEEISTLKVGCSTNNTMNFTFTWGPEAQDIVDGTFKIEVSAWFENHTDLWDNTTYEMFYIIVNVYDDDYSSNDHLGLVFDKNHNGIIDLGLEDRPRLFYADNSTAGAPALTKDGLMILAAVPEGKSCVCTYDPEKGYAFGPFGGPTSYFASKIGDLPTYIPIHICFDDANLYPYQHRSLHAVSVQFRIYVSF